MLGTDLEIPKCTFLCMQSTVISVHNLYRLDLVYLVTFYGHILSDQSDHLFLDIEYFFCAKGQSRPYYLEFTLTGKKH